MINAANVRLFKLLTLTRPHENTHLFTLSNTTQSPFQVTMTIWYERQKWVRLWKCKWERGVGGSTVNRHWLQVFAKFTGETQHCKTLQPSEICTSKVQRSFSGCSLRSAEWGKKENFSLNVQPQSTRCILGILKTPHPTPSWALRERGSDNSFAREQSSNNRHMWTKPGAVLLSFHYIKKFQLNKAGAAFVEVIKVDVQTFYF